MGLLFLSNDVHATSWCSGSLDYDLGSAHAADSSVGNCPLLFNLVQGLCTDTDLSQRNGGLF
jgi:hypothetical protein